jgi:hypothetical protein
MVSYHANESGACEPTAGGGNSTRRGYYFLNQLTCMTYNLLPAVSFAQLFIQNLAV